jgi:hypothetical protein
MLEATVYVIFCVLTGLYGFDRRMGFFGTFLISLVLTPVLVLAVLLLTAPKHSPWRAWWQSRFQPRPPSTPQSPQSP